MTVRLKPDTTYERSANTGSGFAQIRFAVLRVPVLGFWCTGSHVLGFANQGT
jgi:hypothetical protein